MDNQNTQKTQSTQSTPNTPNTPNTQSTPITFLPQHGHYRHLRVYQVTEMIYDITFYFTQHYLNKGDRTIEGDVIRKRKRFSLLFQIY